MEFVQIKRYWTVWVTALHSYLDSLHARMATRPSSWKRHRTRPFDELSDCGTWAVPGCCNSAEGQILCWFLTGSTTRPDLPGGSGAVARCRKPHKNTSVAILCFSVGTFLSDELSKQWQYSTADLLIC